MGRLFAVVLVLALLIPALANAKPKCPPNSTYNKLVNKCVCDSGYNMTPMSICVEKPCSDANGSYDEQMNCVCAAGYELDQNKNCVVKFRLWGNLRGKPFGSNLPADNKAVATRSLPDNKKLLAAGKASLNIDTAPILNAQRCQDSYDQYKNMPNIYDLSIFREFYESIALTSGEKAAYDEIHIGISDFLRVPLIGASCGLELYDYLKTLREESAISISYIHGWVEYLTEYGYEADMKDWFRELLFYRGKISAYNSVKKDLTAKAQQSKVECERAVILRFVQHLDMSLNYYSVVVENIKEEKYKEGKMPIDAIKDELYEAQKAVCVKCDGQWPNDKDGIFCSEN